MSFGGNHSNGSRRRPTPYERPVLENNESFIDKVSQTLYNIIPSSLQGFANRFRGNSRRVEVDASDGAVFKSQLHHKSSNPSMDDSLAGSNSSFVGLNLLSSTPSTSGVLFKIPNARVNEVEDYPDDDGSATTSGCSSMIPPVDERDYQNEILQLSGGLLGRPVSLLDDSSNFDGNSRFEYFASGTPRSNRIESEVKGQFSLPQPMAMSDAKRKTPQFQLLSSTLSDEPSGPKKIRKTYFSPFYPGKTKYGGASASRKARVLSRAPYQIDVRSSVKSNPIEENLGEFSNLSSTALKVYQSLQRMETPLSDAKKMMSFRQNKLPDTLQSTSFKLTEPAGSVPSSPSGPPKSMIITPSHAVLHKSYYQDSGSPVGGKIKCKVTRTHRGPKFSDKKLHEYSTELPNVTLPTSVINFTNSTSFALAEAPVFTFAPPLSPKYKVRAAASPFRPDSFKFSSPIDAKQKSKNINTSVMSASDFSSSCLQSARSENALDVLSKLTDSIPKSEQPRFSELKDLPGRLGNKWECTDCLVQNDPSMDQCAACTARKPHSLSETTNGEKQGSPLKMNLFHLPSDNWECPTCLIQNGQDKLKCAACETSKPLASKSLEASASVDKPKTWECDVCMVVNQMSDTKCIACEMPRAGPPVSTVGSYTFGTTSLTTSQFKFGIPSDTATSVSKTECNSVPTGSKCDVTKTTGFIDNNSSKTSFLFGDTKSVDAKNSGVPVFKFGDSGNNCKSGNNMTVKFGDNGGMSFKFGENTKSTFKFGSESSSTEISSDKKVSGDKLPEVTSKSEIKFGGFEFDKPKKISTKPEGALEPGNSTGTKLENFGVLNKTVLPTPGNTKNILEHDSAVSEDKGADFISDKGPASNKMGFGTAFSFGATSGSPGRSLADFGSTKNPCVQPESTEMLPFSFGDPFKFGQTSVNSATSKSEENEVAAIMPASAATHSVEKGSSKDNFAALTDSPVAPASDPSSERKTAVAFKFSPSDSKTSENVTFGSPFQLQTLTDFSKGPSQGFQFQGVKDTSSGFQFSTKSDSVVSDVKGLTSVGLFQKPVSDPIGQPQSNPFKSGSVMDVLSHGNKVEVTSHSNDKLISASVEAPKDQNKLSYLSNGIAVTSAPSNLFSFGASSNSMSLFGSGKSGLSSSTTGSNSTTANFSFGASTPAPVAATSNFNMISSTDTKKPVFNGFGSPFGTSNGAAKPESTLFANNFQSPSFSFGKPIFNSASNNPTLVAEKLGESSTPNPQVKSDPSVGLFGLPPANPFPFSKENKLFNAPTSNVISKTDFNFGATPQTFPAFGTGSAPSSNIKAGFDFSSSFTPPNLNQGAVSFNFGAPLPPGKQVFSFTGSQDNQGLTTGNQTAAPFQMAASTQPAFSLGNVQPFAGVERSSFNPMSSNPMTSETKRPMRKAVRKLNKMS